MNVVVVVVVVVVVIVVIVIVVVVLVSVVLAAWRPACVCLLFGLGGAIGNLARILAQLFMVSIFVTLGLKLSAYVALTVVALLGMITSLMDEAAPVYAREDKYSWATEAAACGAAPVH